jgi:hypothetical protein
LGDLDKCQLTAGCNQSGYKLVIGQHQWTSATSKYLQQCYSISIPA